MNLIYRRLSRAFWFTFALIFIIESWLWDHVKEWLRILAQKLGAERIEAWIADAIKELSPPATLGVFAVPFVMILPLKIYAVEEIAQGHVGYEIMVIFAAKTLGLGVVAFLFDVCRDKLMQMPWFARFYALVLRVRAWAYGLLAPVRLRLHEILVATRLRLSAYIGVGRSQFLRKLELIRVMTRRRGGA